MTIADGIVRAGHVALRTSRLREAVAFSESVLGLREVERRAGETYLTCNERHHELVLIAADRNECDHIAFEMQDVPTLVRARDDLVRRGVHVIDAPLEAGVDAAVRFVGPGGFVFELFAGMRTDQPARYDTAGVRPMRFEHITVNCNVKPELETFIRDVLGFRLSDRSGESIAWYHCSPDHHTLNVIASDVNALHHYAWKIDDWSSLLRVGDQLLGHGGRFMWGPGHHGVGDNYFGYFLDPQGALVEYSWNLFQILDEASYVARDWPDVPDTVNLWGWGPPEAFFRAGVPVAAAAVAERRSG
jgi:catechol 2,3-dioxygenase-like lactoylglutathione lyase family enzyme